MVYFFPLIFSVDCYEIMSSEHDYQKPLGKYPRKENKLMLSALIYQMI